jgi:spoIIIJ-associated protein
MMSDDSPMQRGEQWLKSLFKLAGLSAEIHGDIETEAAFNGDSTEPDAYWLTIDETNFTAEQIKIFIGRDGDTLDATQYLVNSILNLNQPPEEQASFTVELAGYRVRRQAEIRAIAEEVAERVRNSRQEVEIRSLSSAERRQVHMYLKDFTDLETFSRGKEPYRLLVVRPASYR